MVDVSDFYSIVSESSELSEFLRRNPLISDPERLTSRWDVKNKIYSLTTSSGKYVLKQINEEDWVGEIAHYHAILKSYPGFMPKIVAESGNNIIMEFAEGNDLLTVFKKPFHDTKNTAERLGLFLSKVYGSLAPDVEVGEATSQISYCLKYADYGFSGAKELLEKSLPSWQEVLRGYPRQQIHNDLNSLNVFVCPNAIKTIDPRADKKNIRDRAKDLGRLLAAVTCQMHDNGYNQMDLELIAGYIGGPFDRRRDATLVQRTAFYVGQSYLSFSRWDTDNLAKEGLFEVGADLLQSGPKAYPSFEEFNGIVAKVLSNRAYRKD